MMSTKLPSVLQAPPNNSISMERALKQIQRLLLEVKTEADDCIRTDVCASLDDVDTMLAAIDRSE